MNYTKYIALTVLLVQPAVYCMDIFFTTAFIGAWLGVGIGLHQKYFLNDDIKTIKEYKDKYDNLEKQIREKHKECFKVKKEIAALHIRAAGKDKSEIEKTNELGKKTAELNALETEIAELTYEAKSIAEKKSKLENKKEIKETIALNTLAVGIGSPGMQSPIKSEQHGE